MPFIPPPTLNVTAPESGIVVTLKSRLSYGDRRSIYSEVFAGTTFNTSTDAPEKPSVTWDQAMNLTVVEVERRMMGWDLVDEAGNPVPCTRQAIEKYLTEGDISELLLQVRAFEEESKKK